MNSNANANSNANSNSDKTDDNDMMNNNTKTISLTDLIQQMKQTDMQNKHQNKNKSVTIVPMTPANSTSDLTSKSSIPTSTASTASTVTASISISSATAHSTKQHPSTSGDKQQPPEPSMDYEAALFQVEAVSMQLFGLHHKLINISQRLAEHHLRNYWSSSVMQALRTSARRIADSVALLSPLGLLLQRQRQTNKNVNVNVTVNNTTSTSTSSIAPFSSLSSSSHPYPYLYQFRPSSYLKQLLHQYAWLWEYCGHFARSFAADHLWREQGHACGEDVIALLQDVENACHCLGVVDHDDDDDDDEVKHKHEQQKQNLSEFVGSNYISEKTRGQVSLYSLSGLVIASPSSSKLNANANANANEDESKRAEEIDKQTVADKYDSIVPPPSSVVLAEKLLNQQSQMKREKRQVLIASVICYSRAIGTFKAIMDQEDEAFASSSLTPVSSSSNANINLTATATATATQTESTKKTAIIARENSDERANILSLLRKRLGDACNEIGKSLLSTVKELLGASMSSKTPAAPLLESAQFWFQEGLDHFEQCNDLRNIALLRCNLCQCCKISANAHVSSSSSKKNEHGETIGNNAEECLQAAADHLQKAHSALIQRDEDPKTWDMVSEELAATFLVLGVRRRQSLLGGGTTPVVVQALRLTPGKERSVVHPMEQALGIYEKLQNAHQAAAAHYQLALFYAKVWTCQRNETKTREKLSSAFLHYSHAHRYFFSAMRGNEPTFVILSLDLSNLYSSVSGAECLKKALACCLDTCDAFSREAVEESIHRNKMSSGKDEWFEKMTTLAESIEDRVIKLLLNLVKVEKEDPRGISNNDASKKDKFKNMYRDALKFKMTKNTKSDEGYHSSGHNSQSGFKVYDLLSSLKGQNVID